ncbi:glycosyltransferase family 2 protein [Paenibacillus chibensis]|uniref:glycosyltransferase family 2 protein n=1 Tax=Paenibacillus chibensis TaxID=59846 RepID=UPI000FDBB6E4|nr:glycosyltransferase [Paenibacillus chibensis]MEC0370784.1 glycosyltransferase [Paenibacillus chibensis]
MNKESEINQLLLKIDEMLSNGLIDDVYQEYIGLVKKLDSHEFDNLNGQLKANVLISFAFFLFGASEFEEFFTILIAAQKYDRTAGVSEDVEKFLFKAFIEPNINQFKSIYEANIDFLNSNKYLHNNHLVDFDELPFWLLPTGNLDEYYLFDKKEKLIMDKISLFKYQNLQSLPTSDAFSDFLLLEDWNWSNILTFTNPIRTNNKKTYIVVNNPEKFLSCLQGALLVDTVISNVLIFDNLNNLNTYFTNTNAFLPRNIIDLSSKNEAPQFAINEIHKSRTSKENRKGDRPLLSICIPSYNRGNRAYNNITRLLKSYYDEEIEIIISNNGTQNETKIFYDQIQKIDDARVQYWAFEENMGYALNLCKVCEMARGEFILLISDEDILDLNVLPEIMNILSTSKDTLSIMRTSTTSQYNLSNGTAPPGKEALLNFMLSSNYMSGIIYNNSLLKKYKGIEYVKENLNNSVCFWYPHMFWELLLCQYGSIQSTNLVLINEGQAEKTECDEMEINDVIIPYYATIEGRLEQHKDFSKVFNDLEICNSDPELLREMYIKLCAKTLYLTAVSINVFYKKTSHSTNDLLEQSYNFCSNEDFYKINVNHDDNHYQNDFAIITQYYEQYKAII